jgi:diguanylate cyclase (GGDEF)-like protein
MANARLPIWIRSLGRLRARLVADLFAGLRSLIQRPSGSHTSILEVVADVQGVERFRWILRNMLWFGVALHLLFMAVFFALQVWSLGALNIASVLSYLLAARLLQRGQVDAPFAIGGAEVAAHAAIVTLLLGIRPGFFIFLPLLTVLTFLNPKASLRTKILWSVAQALLLMVVVAVAETNAPVLVLAPEVQRLLMVVNAALFVGGLSFLTHVVSEAARSAEGDLRRALARVDELARTDALTGLLNRRAMSELLEIEAARVERNGRTFAVVVADLDDFKGVNDAYGHPVGDHALRCVAARLLGAVRAQDHVARWGGEEFLLLLPETDAKTALRVAERLRSAVSEPPLQLDDHEYRATATFGLDVYHSGATVHEVVRQADRALYAGKRLGKDRVVQGLAA